MGSVIYDPQSGELRNDVTFFQQAGACPDDIRWSVEVGDVVRPGALLGRFVWPGHEGDAVIVAPLGCGGVVRAIHREVVCRFLDASPSQILLEIGVPPGGVTRLRPALPHSLR